MIKAITFDFWNTLYKSQSTPDIHTHRKQKLHTRLQELTGVSIPLEKVQVATKLARQVWRKTWEEEHYTLNALEWISIVLQELNLTLNDTDKQSVADMIANSLLDHRPRLVDDGREMLPLLAQQYKLAIISDTGTSPGRVLSEIMEEDGIIPYFTHFTFSDELGRSKPHAKAFLSTLQALEVTPAEAVHVGDMLRTDIQGAQAVGLRAVQYTGVDIDPNPHGLTIKPDAIIATHHELKPLIDQWNDLP